MTIVVTDHAVDRWLERVQPGMRRTAIETRIRAACLRGLRELPPLWCFHLVSAERDGPAQQYAEVDGAVVVAKVCGAKRIVTTVVTRTPELIG